MGAAIAAAERLKVEGLEDAWCGSRTAAGRLVWQLHRWKSDSRTKRTGSLEWRMIAAGTTAYVADNKLSLNHVLSRAPHNVVFSRA